MKEKNIMKYIVIIAISILLVVIITQYVLNPGDKINQGKYRVTDSVITSSIIINQKQDVVDDISNMTLDISQENILSLLITKDYKISKATVDNISISDPIKKGNIYISQNKDNKIYDINRETVVDIYCEDYSENETEQYKIDLKIVNDECLKDVNLPSQTNVVRFDGTILELLNQNIEEYIFNVSFNLNLYDEIGNKFTCKIKLKLPDEELIKSGLVVIRDDNSNYVFKAK